ncbi:uncharacterized protein LOC121861721 [Homarus americanus]|uniref:uncharacterized protein LOC121861721 n=1 Tax=Homarus americanus TaxID=6706 RepID=UPI001C48785F|nr:uncharacterized protein LOC121861721 [Homarus americanus]
MQRGLWTVPRDDVFLRYNFTGTEPLTHYTICYRLRTTPLTPIYNDGDDLRVYVNDQALAVTSSTTYEVLPEQWEHLCYLINPTTVTVYWQGEIIQGDITQVSFWDRLLLPEEIEDLARCRALGRGNVFSLDTATLELFGPIKETSLALSELCRQPPRYVVLPEGRTFSESLHKCRFFGASMAVAMSDRDNNLLFSHLQPFVDVCGNNYWKMWMGLTDEVTEGVWVNVNTEEPVNYVAIEAGDPDGGIFDNCMAMKPNGFWGGELCRMKKCGSCTLLPSTFLYLRGLCFDDGYQTRFRLDGYIDSRPFFRGFYDQSVMWSGESETWFIINTENNQSLAWTRLEDTQEYPLGQHEWIFNSTVCDNNPGDAVNISLSICNSGQFMCLNGECISHHLRCNLRHDCADGSDEDNCGVVMVNSAYRWYLPPSGPNRSALVVIPSITLTRFTNIDDVNMVISLEFYLTLQWRDDRLTFKHLRADKETVLYKEDVKKIWKPEYLIMNLDSGQVKLLSTAMSITTAKNASNPYYNDVDTDLVYPGEANVIALTEHYIASFSCGFDLYAYPFDTQACSLDLELLSIYDKYVQFKVDEGTVSYNGPGFLSRYAIRNLQFGEASRERQLYVVFELRRRKGMTVLSTFVPSVLLLLVSWATLFVKLDALNVRAIMSLTTLLVLYTLFSNLSSSLPTTATIKLIDIWFFFIIFLLFFNIIVHIFVNIENNWIHMNQDVVLKVTPKEAFNESTFPNSVRLFVWYRKCILPVLILVFNIIFWILVLTYT